MNAAPDVAAVLGFLRERGVAPAGLGIDSRQVRPGEVFLAWPGARVDGRRFIPDAVARGAAAVLYEAEGFGPLELAVPSLAVSQLAALAGELAHEVYGRPSEKLWLCGVTGTNGKTSISQWIAQALDAHWASKTGTTGTPSLPSPPGGTGTSPAPQRATVHPLPPPPPGGGGDQSAHPLGRGIGDGSMPGGHSGPQGRCAVIGTLGNGFIGHLAGSLNTTPDAVTLHRDLAAFSAAGAGACAMEVSSIGLDQGRTNGARFHTAVFTNLTRDHLEYHGTMESYGAAKARLFHWPGLRRAVVNLDDGFGRALAAELHGRVPLTAYTLGDGAGVGTDLLLRAERLTMTATGQRFTVLGREVEVPLLGRFNTANLLAVLGALLAAGLDEDVAVASLARLAPPPGRMECLGGENAPLVVVDYAHTPDALEKTLATLRETAQARGGRLLCLFGCGGDRDPGKRPQMGAVAESLADAVLLTSDNPRGEEPQSILDAIAAGMKAAPAREPDRARAIARLVAEAAAADVVLLAGKGHETYQEIQGQRLHLSDREEARRALEHRP